MILPKLVVLDRDGVLNRMVVHVDHGLLDSPMNIQEVSVGPDVPIQLARLTKAGIGLSIATNQPAWAKGKTSKENLELAHAEIVRIAQSNGATILSSHICFHRAEDGCRCRKPNVGLLEEALIRHSGPRPSECWMVGDGVTDIQAGAKLGFQTAFLGAKKADMITLFDQSGCYPTFWGKSLVDFTDFLLKT